MTRSCTGKFRSTSSRSSGSSSSTTVTASSDSKSGSAFAIDSGPIMSRTCSNTSSSRYAITSELSSSPNSINKERHFFGEMRPKRSAISAECNGAVSARTLSCSPSTTASMIAASTLGVSPYKDLAGIYGVSLSDIGVLMVSFSIIHLSYELGESSILLMPAPN